MNVGFEVLTAVVMKSPIFWDIMPCSLLKVNQYFRGTCYLHLQGTIWHYIPEERALVSK
jgi:hypothetical protein